jgi:putative membrane-bound dehydrogenase-like protein
MSGNCNMLSMKKRVRSLFVYTPVALVTVALRLESAEPLITAQDLPRVPAVEPKDALSTFRLKKGFHLELIASEPLIASPVAMAFDERGRLFVVEMIDYSERRDQLPHLGRIRLLEDTDGDGVFDKSSVYADNLPWPTGVFCYGGGIFVIATPDILYLKDTKGDGKADVRETVFSGFAEGVQRINVQELPNSLIWGLDNRIHGATSGEGGLVRSLRHPETKLLDLHGRDFAVEPRSMTITAEAGGGQHGLSFDDYGHRFTCNNSDHIRLFMYDERYAARNPFYDMPSPLASIAVDGPAAEVYRVSLEEPWRVIRTRWRVAGVMTGPVEGGGRSSGYFTGATGITIYRGNAFPADFHGNAFVGECAFNLVHRKKLCADDVGLKAERPADEQNVEFLASTDNWFRPVQFANAPDGTLYVIDMYREIVEHPWSLPDSIKKFLDLNSGSDRGRIYRIVPDGFKQPKLPRLDQASTSELIALLEHPNGWHRDTAARLLYERQDKAAAPALVKVHESSSSPLGRLHALYVLDGLGSLQERDVIRSLTDPDPHLREHAVKLSERFFDNGIPSQNLWSKLRSLTNDPAINVRYQAALSLGEVKLPDRLDALEQLARRDRASRWVQAAVLSSLSEGADEMFARLVTAQDFRESDSGEAFLRQLAGIVGAKNEQQGVSRVLSWIDQMRQPEISFPLLEALGEGLLRANSSLRKADHIGLVQRRLVQAAQVARDPQAPEVARLEAVRLVGMMSYDESSATLISLLDPAQPQAVQLAAVSTLGRYAEPQVAAEMIQRWVAFKPQLKSAGLSVLLSRPDRAIALLKAIEAGGIQTTELTTSQTKFLRNHRNPAVRDLAVKVLGEAASSSREKVVESFQDALRLRGDAASGKTIYLQRCSSCHRLGGDGYALGPDLVTVKSAGKEKTLANILDPNREVAPNYIAFEIETKDGESAIGIIASETTSTITVGQAYGKQEVIPRVNMKSMRSLGQSLMPEGLEQGLTSQDLANLLEYISTAEAGK